MPGFRRRGPEIDLDLERGRDGVAHPHPAGARSRPGGPPLPGLPRPSGGRRGRGWLPPLTAGSLAADRGADRRRFAVSLERGTLGAEDAAAWLRVLGEARRALAARLGVAEEGWEQAPPSPGLALLALFGCVQDELATVLLGSR